MQEEKKYFYTVAKISGIKFVIYATQFGICRIEMNSSIDRERYPRLTKLQEDDPYLFGVLNELEEYFQLKRKTFSVPMDLLGTIFQLNVWNQLTKIPYGETRSYKFIAEKLGNPKAVRAVGRANGVNPLPIIIPCHRVINSNGKLGGYSAGIKIKIKLLELEGNLSMELFE